MPILSGDIVTAATLNRLQPKTYRADCTASITAAGDVTGATITLTTETDGAIVEIKGAGSYNWTANTAISTITCQQNGVPLSGKIICDPDGTTGRETNYQQWRVNPGVAGSYTFKLVGEAVPASMTIDATHTTIHATVYEAV